MPSLDDTFKILRKRLKMGTGIRNAGDDPVFYFIFSQKYMLTVKRKIKSWKAALERDGFNVNIFSMADAIHEILQSSDFRQDWLEGEKDAPMAFNDINESLKDVILSQSGILLKTGQYLETFAGQKDTIVFITDLEALHPYLRVGTIEQNLQGQFTVPTVIFYPGEREGNSLRFLGVYPADGNYRSIHIGG
jgi:hypothetical protein